MGDRPERDILRIDYIAVHNSGEKVIKTDMEDPIRLKRNISV